MDFHFNLIQQAIDVFGCAISLTRLQVREDNRPLSHISCFLSAKTVLLVMLRHLLSQTANKSLILAHNIITPLKNAI